MSKQVTKSQRKPTVFHEYNMCPGFKLLGIIIHWSEFTNASHVSFLIDILSKSLPTVGTDEWFLSCVYWHVAPQLCRCTEHFLTDLTSSLVWKSVL